jgi:hypothetical protein
MAQTYLIDVERRGIGYYSLVLEVLSENPRFRGF